MQEEVNTAQADSTVDDGFRLHDYYIGLSCKVRTQYYSSQLTVFG